MAEQDKGTEAQIFKRNDFIKDKHRAMTMMVSDMRL